MIINIYDNKYKYIFGMIYIYIYIYIYVYIYMVNYSIHTGGPRSFSAAPPLLLHAICICIYIDICIQIHRQTDISA